MTEKTLVNTVRPLFVTNYHTLYDTKFLVSFLYIDGKSVAQFVTEENEFDNPIDKLRDCLIANFDLSSFGVLTATEEIYVSSLAAEDVSAHLVSREETSETFRLFERKDVKQSLIVIHDLVDPSTLLAESARKPNKLEKILIAALLKVASGLNNLSAKLQTKRGN
ncbi:MULTISPECIES: hypothetical protein [Bacillus cereus group]|uniref:hypothetical protein n=1 Tax=Bacillus cereus group TaxID=86661 RepID=UPI0007C1B9DA|nr:MULTISPECIES: hypothetical protein [Bacillus cereus group]AND06126.1 hypothetical protein Bt4C1_02620 [Bacillus thuringiensis serovar alesti]MEC3596245.1 hypothetical protein [Bacillus thuringiensis]MED0828461.1 hypothetical protein [Bacillus pacificus]MED1834839.1 hypothetical protein [Bacillus thuringiensis]MED2208063.1 hypothetical protein [Bacillus thuringiensis]